MSTFEFYVERAAQCRREASEAGLANVRDRCISAAIAWEGMAARMKRTQVYRAGNEALSIERAPGDPAGASNTTMSENEQHNPIEPEVGNGISSPLAPTAQ